MKLWIKPLTKKTVSRAACLLLLVGPSTCGANSPMSAEGSRPVSIAMESARTATAATSPPLSGAQEGRRPNKARAVLGEAAHTPLPRIFTTPFQRMGNSQVPFVSIVLDDGKSYLFALDPGTPNTSIDRATAAATGLPTKTLLLPRGVQIDTLTSTAVLGSSRLKLSEALFVVEDLSPYRTLYPGIAGIIGANLLRQFMERIDFTAGRVNFTLPSSSAVILPASNATMAVALNNVKGHYDVSAAIDGNTAVFSLSTLYDATLIHTAALLSHLKARATLDGLPAGDGTPVRFLRLGRLSIGDRVWLDPVIEQPLTKQMPVANILGLDFLRRFYLTLDLGHQRIYLVPDPAYRADPHEWEGLGIVPTRTADGELVITALGDPSPARAAGLKVGDAITAIQSLPAARLTQEQESALVKRPVGTPIEMTVRGRGGSKPRRVYLRVKKLL